MPPKIDLIDRKILYELDQDSRLSLDKIAKKARCSKQTLHYRIQRLVREGVVTGFITAIDTAKLGYSIYIVWIEMSGISLEKKKDFLNYLVKHGNVQWVAGCGGKFDAAIQIAAKSVSEFNSIFKGIQGRFPGYIKNSVISLIYEYHRYKKVFSLHNAEEREELFRIGEGAQVAADDGDLKLLALLSKDSRAETLELARRSGMSPNTVRSRMKRMEEDGLIKAFTISIQEKKMGIERQHMLVSLHNMNEDTEKELEAFCLEKQEVSFLLRVIGKWDAYIIVDPSSNVEFQNFLTEFRTKFAGIIKDFELANVMDDLKFEYFPMKAV